MSTPGTPVSNSVVAGTSLTLAGVTLGGTDRVLELGVALNNPSAEVVSAVFNGTEVLLRDRVRNISTGLIQRLELWSLVAPTATTADLVLTFSAAVSATATAQPWSGVDPATPRTTSPIWRAGLAIDDNPRDIDGTSVTYGGAGDLQVYWVAIRDDTLTWTPDAGVTQVSNAAGGSLSNRMRLVMLTDTNTEANKVLGTISADTSWQVIGYNLQGAGTAILPTADFTGTPLSGVAPLTVTFTDASTDATGWSYDFDHPTNTATSTDQNPVHQYTQPGIYAVRQTVTNASGSATLVRSAYVNVGWGLDAGAGQFALTGAAATITIATPVNLGAITSSTRAPNRQRLYIRSTALEANTGTELTATAGWGLLTGVRSRDNALAIALRGEWRIATDANATSNPTLDQTGDRVSLLSVLEETSNTDLDLGTGTFTLTGQPLQITIATFADLGGGTFVLTGGALLIASGIEVDAGTGAFTLTGGDLAIESTLPVTLGAGVFTLTGGDVVLGGPRELIVATGLFTVAGGPAVLTLTIPVIGTGWRATVRAVGPRWRIAWRPMSSSAQFPVAVTAANDAGVVLDEIEGYDSTTGAPVVYEAGTIEAFWSATPDGNTPVGAITVTATRNVARPRFVVHFEAAQMTTVLTGRAADSPLWLVLTGSGNFRAVIEHVVRAAHVLV